MGWRPASFAQILVLIGLAKSARDRKQVACGHFLSCSCGRRRPRSALLVASFECRDVHPVAFRQVNIIPAVQQLIAAYGVDRERAAQVAATDGLLLQVDADRLLRIGGQHGGNLGNLLLGHDRSQQTVLDRVLRKDIAERGWDDATDAMVVDRVDRRLARGSAAEIAPLSVPKTSSGDDFGIGR